MPPNEGALTIAVACEDRGHFFAVQHLTDRVLLERIAWLERTFIEDVRRFLGPTPNNKYWSLRHAFKDAREKGLRIHGHFEGGRGEPDAAQARAQLLLWKLHEEPIDVAYLVRDTDHESREKGVKQAVEATKPDFLVLPVLPHPEVEAWHVAGFEPKDKDEHDRLEAVRSQLGFSPPLVPHQLTSTSHGAKTDAKRVLSHLVADDHDRKNDCLDAPLEKLRERGASCGLAKFIDGVEEHVVPRVRMSR